ncbi:unnamed protein product, partial [marine sediment metagenome]
EIDDNDLLESMKASFNIVNVQTVNRSLYFKSWYSGIGINRLLLNYTNDRYSVHEYSSTSSGVNYMLDQHLIVKEFNFIVSDANLSELTNNTITGYSRDIKF